MRRKMYCPFREWKLIKSLIILARPNQQSKKYDAQRLQILCRSFNSTGHRREPESIALLRLLGGDANRCNLRWSQVSLFPPFHATSTNEYQINAIKLIDRYQSGNCGVSIVRSGEAMEQGLRDCCRSIRIGKILVESDAETHVAKVVYARFPDDIAKRQVLLMYPIMSTGNTVVQVKYENTYTFS